MNSVSKLKVVAGYALLLAVMLSSLLFVHKETENLMQSDVPDTAWTDSLLTLLREKDANTIRLLRTMNQATDTLISAHEISLILARQDTTKTQQRVQHRMITHRDTLVTAHKKKGFFRRLGEAFVPPKKDTAIAVKTSTEFAVDTVMESYNASDSLHERLRAAAEQRKIVYKETLRRKNRLQRRDRLLSTQIDSLLKNYEAEYLANVRAEAENKQEVRSRSAKLIGSIAAGAVLLSAFFLILIIRDISRSNRYRVELEEARRRAEELLATREKLMLAITHDFKAPLGSIMGYTDLLSRLSVEERQRYYLDNMKASSEHLLKLVTDLLDFHRLDLNKTEIHRVTFYPHRLLNEIEGCFRPLADAKGLTLNFEVDVELRGTYVCDPLRLKQIIHNLLSNAVKFTERGGITLTARYQQRCLVVDVTDTGKGMEKADCERIFQEFTRLPGAQGQEGFGLGLSIVRMLVNLLDGTIEVQSQPGKGSTFTLRVPIYPIAVDASAAADEAVVDQGSVHIETLQPMAAVAMPESLSMPTPSSRGKMHLLLIDDDLIQLKLTAAMLSHSGITAVACQQVDDLLEALRNDTFDVLLSDVQMPALNGFDLLRLLRASNIAQAQHIPVIAVTARSDMKRAEFLSHGFAGCLHKPFTVEELLSEVNDRTVASAAYQFDALTAFAEDDAEAAASILESFVSETKVHVQRLQQAAAHCDAAEVSAVAHKMLPVFTLIKATELVELLKHLEAMRDCPYSDVVTDEVSKVLLLVEDVLAHCS